MWWCKAWSTLQEMKCRSLTLLVFSFIGPNEGSIIIGSVVAWLTLSIWFLFLLLLLQTYLLFIYHFFMVGILLCLESPFHTIYPLFFWGPHERASLGFRLVQPLFYTRDKSCKEQGLFRIIFKRVIWKS